MHYAVTMPIVVSEQVDPNQSVPNDDSFLEK